MALFDPASAGVRPSRGVAAACLLGLALFLGWQALLTRAYVAKDTRPPQWDQAVHMEIAWDYLQALRAGHYGDIVNLAPKPGMPPFPPLYHLALTRAYFSARPAQAALWINWYYLAALCLCLFGVCWHFRADETAMLATLAFVCAPAVQELYFTQLIDLSVIACAAAAYWALFLSEDFTAWGASLSFGALFAVGMLHKWSFFSYMIPAYLLALKALWRPKSRWKVAAAAAVAVAGCGPWYFEHAALLLPRLTQASSDFAVPVWQGGAFFNYLFSSLDGLGPLLWALGWIGLVAPQYRRHSERGWLVAGWVLLSYLFWAIVPNRQLRFLLPGLPGLAVTLCAGWPSALVALTAAFQFASGFNYAAGWLSPINIAVPFHTVTILPSNPPKAEDWGIARILEEAERRADARPIADLTLVANAPCFNGPNFTWLDKYLGLRKIHIRGVNRRLCEFSEFVVLKDAQLGPPGVISGLPEAGTTIEERGGWFSKAYRQAASWTLPDGSHALLFQQRRLSRPPFHDSRTQFQYYDSPAFTAEDFRVDLGRFDRKTGAYPVARTKARLLSFRGLKLSNVSVEADGLALVPAGQPPLPQWDDVRLLKMERLRIRSASVTAGDLRDFLEERVHGLHVQSLQLDRTLRVAGTFANIAVAAEAKAELLNDPRGLRLTLLSARVGATPLPVAWLGPLASYTFSLKPNPELPFEVDVPRLTLADGRLSIP